MSATWPLDRYFFAPGDQPRGQHHWTVNLYPEGAETPALGLHLGAQIGEHWKCVPARLRAPADGRDFVADLPLKPADGKDLPADGKDHPTETR